MPTGWVPAPLRSARSLCACCCGRVTQRYQLSGDSCYPISLIMAALSNSHDRLLLVIVCVHHHDVHTPITHCVSFH